MHCHVDKEMEHIKTLMLMMIKQIILNQRKTMETMKHIRQKKGKLLLIKKQVIKNIETHWEMIEPLLRMQHVNANKNETKALKQTPMEQMDF